MANKIICDICGKICWDEDDQNELNLYEIRDVCYLCYSKIGDFAHKLKKEKGFYEEQNESKK